jgi:hypothetical protein
LTVYYKTSIIKVANGGLMVVGEVARDYAFFDFMAEDLNDAIEVTCETLYMEYKLMTLGFVIPSYEDQSW